MTTASDKSNNKENTSRGMAEEVRSTPEPAAGKRPKKKRPARRSRKKKPERKRPGWALALRKAASWLAIPFLVLLAWQATILYSQMKTRSLIANRAPEEARRWVGWSNKFSFRSKTNEFLLARCCRKMGDYQSFNHHLLRAHALGYDPVALQREEWLAMAQSGVLDKSEPHLSDLLLDPRGDGQEILEAYVIGYLLIQQYTGAEELLKGWADSYPHDPLPWYLRGVVYRDLSQWKSAESAFRQSLEIEPDYYEASFQLGSVLLTLKKTDEAIEFFEVGSQDATLHVECRVGQAHCYRLLGKPKQARVILDAVVKDYPNDPAASLELGRLALDEGDYETAVHWLEPLVRKDLFNTDARYTLASALREVGRVEDAQGHFDAVTEINDQLANASQMSEAISTRPESAEERLKIGAIYLKYGSESDGLFWIRSGLSVNPTHRPTVEALLNYYTKKAVENPEKPTYGSTVKKFEKMLRELPLESSSDKESSATEEASDE
ncbi:MAG: tetratricopeptide repeat protein [Pirellulaceae bacterium]|jgi:tetratricopeptide (TPR) repeat protein|nr:tetratricopeptide repeat protein [Pirellulaceae bacterium]